MRRQSLYILFAIVIILAGTLYWWISHKSISGSKKTVQDNNQNRPVALVKTAPIAQGNISENITVYGVTIPAPGALQTISVSYESKIKDVFVTNGQEVSKGDTLLEIESSPDTHLQLQQAESSYESTRQSLEHFKRLMNLKLATNDQLTQAEQAFIQAKLNLNTMKKKGINGPQKLLAETSGLIKSVNVQQGAIAPAGSTLIEIVVQHQLEIQLGIEPEDIGHIQQNQEVLLSPVNVPATAEVTGAIRRISSLVNPNTRLVDIFVTLPESNNFLLGEFILGKVSVASSEGLVVPRDAVLPMEDKYIVFTVKNEIAVKHIVQIGLENDEKIEITGDSIQPGDQVVVLGNYALVDGMMVKVEGSK